MPWKVKKEILKQCGTYEERKPEAKNKSSSASKKRSVSAVQTTEDSDEHQDEPTEMDTAGFQFGRNAHKQAKRSGQA